MIEFRALAPGPAVVPHAPVADAPPVLVGISAAMERLRGDVLRAAADDRPILVRGETGSGKSLVARALHEMGPRAKQLCAVVACQAFPETLLEIELFGCAKGSVVGATSDRQGVLEMVDGGTVILENIETTSPRTQSLLEQYFATGRVQPIGMLEAGNPVHTRVVAIAGDNLTNTVSDRRHDAALWARLRANELQVPPLRERPSDVPLLSQFFSAAGDGHGHGVVFSAEAMGALSVYPWPGNVAQLKSVVERLVSQAPSGQVRQADLPVGIRPRMPAARARQAAGASKTADDLFARLQTSHESFWTAVYPLFMKREITRADLRALIARGLDAARGNVDQLVRVFNMPRSDAAKFHRFLRKYGCEPIT